MASMKLFGDGLDQRTERARHLREVRRLRETAKTDEFLRRWRDQAENWWAWFEAQRLSEKEIEAEASADGFRSGRAWLEWRRHALNVTRYFVTEDAFQNLWRALRAHKAKTGDFMPIVQVPNRLIDDLQRWHQAPKFTDAERRQHASRIAAACDELEHLLSQVVPSHDLDQQFSHFCFEDGQARNLFLALGADSESLDGRPYPSISWVLAERLRQVGVDPLWGVRNIRFLARREGQTARILPTKIRSATAKRSYFIRATAEALRLSTFVSLKQLNVGPQLLADVVALLADMDCAADDVRKALAEYPEHSR